VLIRTPAISGASFVGDIRKNVQELRQACDAGDAEVTIPLAEGWTVYDLRTAYNEDDQPCGFGVSPVVTSRK